jgi:K+-sensing histidine kinase KdpD
MVIVIRDWFVAYWLNVIIVFFQIFFLNVTTQYKNKDMSRRSRMLEDAIALRTESLQDIFEDLVESERKLKSQLYVQTLIISALAHDFQSPLKAIHKIAGAIDSFAQQKNYEFVTEIGKSIEDSSLKMSKVLGNTLDYLKIHSMGGEIEDEFFNLYELAAQKIDLFFLPAILNKNCFVNDIPIDLTIYSKPLVIGEILNNLIDNANKNTTEGLVRVGVEISINQLAIEIMDTGTGIPDHLIAWLNQQESDYKDTEATHPRCKTGIGLILVKELSKMVSGTLRAKRNDTGSSISLILPYHATKENHT